MLYSTELNAKLYCFIGYCRLLQAMTGYYRPLQVTAGLLQTTAGLLQVTAGLLQTTAGLL